MMRMMMTNRVILMKMMKMITSKQLVSLQGSSCTSTDQADSATAPPWEKENI